MPVFWPDAMRIAGRVLRKPWPDMLRIVGRIQCDSLAGCYANAWPDVVRILSSLYNNWILSISFAI